MAPGMETVEKEEALDPRNAAEDELRRLSQKEYRPTPYHATQWEFVGDRPKVLEFTSLEMEVLADQHDKYDPMFEDFNVDKALRTGTTFQGPGSDPRQVVEETETAAEIDLAALQAELDARYAEGHQAGFEEGKAAAEKKIAERYEQLSKKMEEINRTIHAEVREKISAIEQHALKVSLDVARKIVGTTVEVKPDYILAILRKAMGSLGAAKALKVRVSPEDYDFLDLIGLPQDLSQDELGVVYASDSSIASGCVVESDFGELNLELDKMWEEIVRALSSGSV